MLQFRAIRSVVRLFPDLLNELIGGNETSKGSTVTNLPLLLFIKLVLTQVQLKGYF